MQSTYAGEADAFIAILNPASTDPSRASQLVYGTFFGGSGGDVGHDIQEDAAGNLEITGYTRRPICLCYRWRALARRRGD